MTQSNGSLSVNQGPAVSVLFGNLPEIYSLLTSSRFQASSLYPFSYIWKQILGYWFTNLPEISAPIYQILLLSYLSKILSFPLKIPLITQFILSLLSYLVVGNNYSHNLLSSSYVPQSLPIQYYLLFNLSTIVCVSLKLYEYFLYQYVCINFHLN